MGVAASDCRHWPSAPLVHSGAGQFHQDDPGRDQRGGEDAAAASPDDYRREQPIHRSCWLRAVEKSVLTEFACVSADIRVAPPPANAGRVGEKKLGRK